MKASAQELVSEGLRDLEHGTAEGNAHAVDVLNQALDVDSGLARLTPLWRRLTSSGPTTCCWDGPGSTRPSPQDGALSSSTRCCAKPASTWVARTG